MDQQPAPIAIIGMSGRFPGARDVDEFWRNISTGVESFAVFTDEELLDAGEDPQRLQDPHYVRSRPVLDDIKGFDATFFGLSPREATVTDPQQRLFTECVWEALESAGYATPDGRGTVGVFAGVNISTYLLTRPKTFLMGTDADLLMAGNDKDALATNVSYRLDLRGPSVAVQTFCSTSLVAVHLACAALRRGECDIALAGGASLRLPDRVGYVYQEGNQASPDGHVRTFDRDARGSMFGDGVAVVALKSLSAAIADRDSVLAVVRGSAMNNDGALKFSFQAPSIEGQRRCVAAAIATTGIDPNDISYVEAHGTATEVGDPMEVAALTSAFGDTAAKQYCLLGSVKPNVGHLDRASGATGLIKVVQSLRHELIPGTRNFLAPNPEIDFADSPFRVTPDPTPWPRQAGRPRVAGLSSLGTGGTNVHAIISEAPVPAPRGQRPHRWQILPVSTRWEAGADAACASLAQRLTDEPDLELADVAYTLQVGRKDFGHRRVVVADSLGAAAATLSDRAGPLRRVETTVGRKVAFLLAGVGEQYPGLAGELYATEPDFRADVDECVRLLDLDAAADLSDVFAPNPSDQSGPPNPSDQSGAAVHDGGPSLARMLGRDGAAGHDGGPSLARMLGRDGGAGREGGAGRDGGAGREGGAHRAAIERAHLVQPAIFVVEYALARQLMRWGIVPEVMVGYSLGEYVAACLSGVLSLPDAVALVARRAELIAELPPGAMLAVAATEPELRAALGDELADLDVAVRAGSQLVLAGPVPAVEAATAVLLDAAIGCRQLDTTHAYHSRMLTPIAGELTEWIRQHIRLNPPTLPYLSNVTGELATAETVTDPAYWARHMCETVQFGAGLAHVLATGELALVEIGPGQSLGALARNHPACRQAQWPLIVTTLPALAERRGAGQVLAEAVAKLWLVGVGVDWAAWHTAGGATWQPGRVRLPTYPFDRQDYWLPPDITGHGASAAFAGGPAFDEDDPTGLLTSLPRLPDAQWISVPVWRQTAPRPPAAELGERWLVFTDTAAADRLAAELRTRVDAAGARVTFARPGERFAAAGLPGADLSLRPGSVEDMIAALRHLNEHDLAPTRVVHLWGLADGLTDESLADESLADDDELTRGLHTLIAFARAAGDLGLSGWSLDVVTSASHQVLPGERVHPERVTTLGPVRLIPVEYPGVVTRLIDIDERSGSALLAELFAAADDQVVGLRGGRRFVPGYEVLDRSPEQVPAVRIRRGGTYLVTGGLGGIGLAMAERLAADYDARLVLFGRTPVPPSAQWTQILADPTTGSEVRRRLTGLRRLASNGATFVTVAGDVSRLADTRRAVASAIDSFGELNGILHCAGVPAVGLMQFKTSADVATVLAPKVAGARALGAAVDGLDLDFVALFSSTTSATGGGAGQVDYCAANAFLDAYAESDPLPGCLVTAIDWGEWTYNGWTSGLDKYDEGSRQYFEQYREKFGVDFDQGWQTLQRVLASGEPHAVISTQDFPTIVASSRRSSIASHQATVRKLRDAMGRHPRAELSTAYVEPASPEEEAIAAVWSEALGVDQVGINDNFFELGGNSLVGMEIIAEVRKALGIGYLPPHLLYQAPTVATLAEAAAASAASAADAAGDEGPDGDDHDDHDGDDAADPQQDLQRSRIEQRRSTLRTRRTA